MIRVHHLNNSRSLRVLWLLEELGQAYEVVRYERNGRTMRAPRTLFDIHPLGKAPVLEDGDQRIAETGLIVEYLISRYGEGRLAPAHDGPAWWRYRYWLHYAEGSAMPPLLLKLVIDKLGPLGWPAKRFVEEQIRLHLDFLENEIAEREWFAGDNLSGADIMLSFPLEVAVARGGLDASWPSLWRFLGRIQMRPAYQRAVENGGPYDYATRSLRP
jgi:glutathione S-transferase